ncbi:MAG TPA: T9SS type A sorting domain-containing protein [Bacteroidales bacterium]|nr:T9SS type A sorting domain-containing protein [Bacteroidales bacterium]HNZ41944.1 T9SS type A sorting domain-containing protein [Bacteroidales bacterium]HPI28922.1 T9SS type A sorting domain-containing protein [Bacteroidales bacterium]
MIKKILFSLVAFALCIHAEAQWTNKTMVFETLSRSYRVYKSPNYNPSVPASLVITLHGLGDNMTNFSQLGFNYIADTANIIVVCPQAVNDPLVAAVFGYGTAWNSGAGMYYSGNWYFPNSSVNDIGFIHALVDSARASYSIDPSRMYICGFSMGGFMTERMALQSNLDFAAFASMSGTIGAGISTYNPGRSVPIAHFHGTADSTVYYVGNQFGIDPDSLIRFWVVNNGCNPVPDSTGFADTAADSITVDKFSFTGAGPDNEVLFYRMNGAGHEVLYEPDNDMTEILEIWKFFRRHQNATASVAEQVFQNDIFVYPNPAADFINIILPETVGKTTVELFTLQGTLVYSATPAGQFHHIPLQSSVFRNGMYLLRVSGPGVNLARRLVVQH